MYGISAKNFAKALLRVLDKLVFPKENKCQTEKIDTNVTKCHTIEWGIKQAKSYHELLRDI